MDLTEDQISEHDRKFRSACRLVERELPLQIRVAASPPSWIGRRRLKKAGGLLGDVLRLKPDNWTAWWVLARIAERGGDPWYAMDAFRRAVAIAPGEVDLVRDASLLAFDLGEREDGRAMLETCRDREPTASIIRAHLALADLFDGNTSSALGEATAAVAESPDDRFCIRILGIVKGVIAGTRPCPRTVDELER